MARMSGSGRGDHEPDREPAHSEEAGDGALTLRAAQAAVDAWISQFEEGYWPPLSLLARLIEEVGELARELNHLHGSKPRKPDEPDGDLELEIGDILFVLIALANDQGVDLDTAFARVMEKYRSRDSGRWTPKTENN